MIKTDIEALEAVKKGCNNITSIVSKTFGGAGKNVILTKQGRVAIVTKDGVTVAREYPMIYDETYSGVSLIKTVATSSDKKAGDGTTTTSILANEMINNAFNLFSTNGKDLNPIQVKVGMDMAKKDVIEKLKKISKKKASNKDLYNICKVSTNSDLEITKTLYETFINTGKNKGTIRILTGSGETFVEYSRGYQIDNGYLLFDLVNDSDNNSFVLENNLTLLIEDNVTNTKFLDNILPHINRSVKTNIIIIANSFSRELVMLMSEYNKTHSGVISLMPVKCHSSGDDRREIMKDLGIITGSKVYNSKNMHEISFEHLGRCTKAVQDGNITVLSFSDDQYNSVNVKERIESISKQIKIPRISEATKKELNERYSNLGRGIATIYVSGDSQVELYEKVDRYTDAYNSLKLSSSGGILKGAGLALLQVSEELKYKDLSNKSEAIKAGYDIVLKSIEEPFKQILINSNKTETFISEAKNRIIKSSFSEYYDVIEDCFLEAKNYVICDPLDVTVTAVENSVSTTSTFISTGAIVASDAGLFAKKLDYEDFRDN